jgi:glycosyltransferase involved in cell wall biosynthesis
MVAREKIGIPFSLEENWIAGTYYVLNLVHSLKLLPDEDKPHLTFLIGDFQKDASLIEAINYPYLSIKKVGFNYSIADRIINKIWRMLIKHNLIIKTYTSKDFTHSFPIYTNYPFEKVPDPIFWIPDFQQHYFPHFFQPNDIEWRNRIEQKIAGQRVKLVLSSESAETDFKKFYPNAICQTTVVHFAVTHPPFQHLNFNSIRQKYQLPEKYFFSPNQFWIHKNHQVVLEAMKILKEQGCCPVIVFSGKEYDYRFPNYFESLKQFVSDNKLSEHVRFLGFIDREEQLKIMSESIAVIQPSLFEGWSTVVEDAKALNKMLIISDIPVHKEQINLNCEFFNPNDSLSLANLIKKYSLSDIPISSIDYEKNRLEFAISFLSCINSPL